MSYANIIVNISHENLDKTFQYTVPSHLEGTVSVGDYVSIPFGKGNRQINGYVMELTDTPAFDPAKQKEILSIVKDADPVESKLLKLAAWMKERYGSTMITALKTVLPTRKKIRGQEKKTIILVPDADTAADQLRIFEQKHQTARARLLRELIREKELDYRLVTSKLNISPATLKLLEEMGILRIDSERVYRNMKIEASDSMKPVLNPAQKKIADSILSDLKQNKRKTYLIRGITGSGKTEVYMEIIEAVISRGRQAIVLIPEIALTYQTVLRFYKRFGDRVSTLHSKLSEGERYDQFERAKKGEIDVMIGPRSALFTPFGNLGLIVIDEEHESTYKSENMPKYHAREVAEELARLHGASLILGSATPSLNSYYEAMQGNYQLFTLDQRAKEARLPEVEITDLREELKKGNRSIFGTSLREQIFDRLEKNEQVMLFLNRRGYAGFVSCRSCGHVMTCPHCDVSLSEHRGGKLICHYCGYEQKSVTACPECGSKMIGGMRAGTQQIEEQIKKIFPQARVLRMDADTTKKKDSYEQILSAFANREADILVGTQMIVKGHDFPYVTLVGILAADLSLYANDYRASERTFQLLTQAAGRAGRGDRTGNVVIQTYQPEHYSIVYASKQDYEGFYTEEIAYRKLLGYPPVSHLLAILCESSEEEKAEAYARQISQVLKKAIEDGQSLSGLTEYDIINLIGPADATVKKISDVYRQVLYLKAQDMQKLKAVKDLTERYLEEHPDAKIRVTFDLDPLHGY
ncbi:MAG: primosomal protein N' [Lachnospiraceae bacterium]|nr:primosomal protein N' [Lachnospiraceae bacterium]